MTTTYGQFCPVAMASEVLTERWTPLVVRELLCGSTRFNDLRRGVPLMSPALLSKRLKTLERVGVVEHRGGEYLLTPAGRGAPPGHRVARCVGPALGARRRGGQALRRLAC